MARNHAQLLTRIWADPEWLALPIDAQWLYQLVLSQPSLSQAGVLTIPRSQWVNLTSDEDAGERIERARKLLEEARFIVVDDTTDELLIRSFIRNDAVRGTPGVFAAAMTATLLVQSPRLRTELLSELRRLDRAELAKKKPAGGGKVWPVVLYDQALVSLQPHPEPPSGARPSDQGEPSANGIQDAIPDDMPGNGIRNAIPNGAGAGVGAVGSKTPERSTGVSSVARATRDTRVREAAPTEDEPNEPDVIPGPAVVGRRARQRERERRSLRNSRARSIAAWRLVEEWAATVPSGRKPTRRVLEALGTEVDEHLRGDWSETDLRAVLALWGTKPVGPAVFGSVAVEWANRQTRPAARADRNIAALDALRRPEPDAGLPPVVELRAIEGA